MVTQWSTVILHRKGRWLRSTGEGAWALEITWLIKQEQEAEKVEENEVSVGLKMIAVTVPQAVENVCPPNLKYTDKESWKTCIFRSWIDKVKQAAIR